MKTISIVGAGTSGLIFAHALLREGYHVTLYSDRSAEQWLNEGPPTGTAFLYNETIDIERELGLDHWSEDMFKGDGVLLDFCPYVGAERLVASGLFRNGGAAVDLRMKVHRWLHDFEERGGQLVIEAVNAERLDAISQSSDLTVLATGKADLARIIPRDPERSVYDQPQRNLAMVIVEGVHGWSDRVDFTPIKFNFFGDIGEFFWVPYTHKSGRDTWCVLFEAKAGGQMDRFGDCRSAQDVVDVARSVMEDITPWELDAIRDMRPVEGDPHCWLKGRFAPTVRQPFGRLPFGNLVMPIGDTALTFDPIGGQGGNCAHRNARYLADAVIARGDAPFDETWMTAVADDFWEFHGKAAYHFNNILLEPLTEAGRLALMSSALDRGFADEMFFGNFSSPNGFFPWIKDPLAIRQVLRRFAGGRQSLTVPA
jgi:flavin-dependent dehydrogenase